MHRTISISLAPEHADVLCSKLEQIKGVIGLSRARGHSVKPPGDIVTAHVLNRHADEVLKAVKDVAGDHFSVVTAEVHSFTDPAQQETIEGDVDEAIWEEMETGLRHQGRITPNYLALMALGGAVAAIGLVSDPVPQAIAFIASAMIAPGFEPLAKVPLGAILGRGPVVTRGLVSALGGYAILITSAALMFAILLGFNDTSARLLAENAEVRTLNHPDVPNVALSILGGLSGMIMIVAYRRSTIGGPLMLLSIVPAAALIGAGAACGQGGLVKQGFERMLLDVAIIWVTGAIVVWIKQKWTHKRAPLV